MQARAVGVRPTRLLLAGLAGAGPTSLLRSLRSAAARRAARRASVQNAPSEPLLDGSPWPSAVRRRTGRVCCGAVPVQMSRGPTRARCCLIDYSFGRGGTGEWHRSAHPRPYAPPGSAAAAGHKPHRPASHRREIANGPGGRACAADRRARHRTLQRRRGFVGRLVKTSESRSSAGRGLRTPRDVRPSVGRLRELVRAERRADGNKHTAAAQSLLSGPISGSDRSRSLWGFRALRAKVGSEARTVCHV